MNANKTTKPNPFVKEKPEEKSKNEEFHHKLNKDEM